MNDLNSEELDGILKLGELEIEKKVFGVPVDDSTNRSGEIDTGISHINLDSNSATSMNDGGGGDGLADEGNYQSDEKSSVVSFGPSENMDGVSGICDHLGVTIMLCSRCGGHINGPYLTALNKLYHPEHFNCEYCLKPFINGVFLIYDGNPCCESDYYKRLSRYCHICKNLIRDKFINTDGYYFHPEHFVCESCGIPLSNKKYKFYQEDGVESIRCLKCMENTKKVVAEICKDCGKEIGTKYVVYKGKKIHLEHHYCRECGISLTYNNYGIFEEKIYCGYHYNMFTKRFCNTCKEKITGLAIEAFGFIWHPEHFACKICGEVLDEFRFFEYKGDVYCEYHHALLFKTSCHVCKLPLGSDNYLSFTDKCYHKECFICTVCEKPSDKKEVVEWCDNFYCINCYQKMPYNYQRIYESRRRVEKKYLKAIKSREKKAVKEINNTRAEN